MLDHSALDTKYFINRYVYNCPFCNRRHVSYEVVNDFQFDWSEQRKCYGYLVKCKSCGNASMHLSFELIPVNTDRWDHNRFEVDDGLDERLFYSVPTSFFALDDNIPKVLRELVTEAEGCLKSNFLTGASACARKVIYELAKREGGKGVNYEDRVKSLKTKFSHVDPAFFDTLLTIQQVTSTKVHEEAYDGWAANHVRVILASLNEVLREIYVVPAQRAARRKAILGLKDELMLTPKGGKATEEA